MPFGLVPVAAIALAQTAIVPKQSYAWMCHGGDATHSAISYARTQKMQHVDWSAAVDETPRYSGNSLLSHYGSPCITPLNTVVISVKKNLNDTFVMRGYNGSNGALKWETPTDYVMPSFGWTPMCGPTLLPVIQRNIPQQVAFPMAGGRIGIRFSADNAAAGVQVVTYYGASNYNGNPSAYDGVRICTPLTAGPDGSIYFGVRVSGSNPLGLTSGLVRIAPNKTGSWVAASTLSGDSGIADMKMNAAPAVTVKGSSVYCMTSSGGWGRGVLVKVGASSLSVQGRVLLKDPKSGLDAIVEDSGTASPMIGPDGDVFQGVLENTFPSNHDRGWLLHFNSDLTVSKTPGSFGWDDTPSVVPANLVRSYGGSETYLLLSKYNNYAGVGGDGKNRIALVEPNHPTTDPIANILTMNAFATVLGPTPDAEFPNTPGAVREWCVNSAAIDTSRRAAILNCEDGVCYRWSFDKLGHTPDDSMQEALPLTPGIGEAYTATAIGPDGHIYATSNARLYAIGGSTTP